MNGRSMTPTNGEKPFCFCRPTDRIFAWLDKK
jgi:hypothetical protein